MQHYATFAACGAEALDYCAQRFQVDISKLRRSELMEASEWLPAFADAAPALTRLRAAGHRLFAFSNGTARNQAPCGATVLPANISQWCKRTCSALSRNSLTAASSKCSG